MVEGPGGLSQVLRLTHEQLKIGRSSRNTAVLADLALSREHLALHRKDGQWVVEDAGSRNGTYLNNRMIEGPTVLAPGDNLKFGSCRARFTTIDPHDSADGEALAGSGIVTVELPPDTGPDVSAPPGLFPMTRQLDLARHIQRFLLPRESPTLPGYRILGDTQPCFEVGGDFYDFLFLQDGSLGLCLGDVARKGVPAALLGHYTQALLRGAWEFVPSLEELTSRVNREVCLHSPINQFVTAWICRLDPASGEVQFVNAGHCPPALVKADGSVEWIEHSGMLLGVDTEAVYNCGSLTLEPGSTLVLYSDGVVECCHRAHGEYGQERFASFLAERKDFSPDRIMRDMEAELERFSFGLPPMDDITLLIIQRAAEKGA